MVLVVVSPATLGVVLGTFPSSTFTNTLSHGSNKGGQTLPCVLCLGIQMFWEEVKLMLTWSWSVFIFLYLQFLHLNS